MEMIADLLLASGALGAGFYCLVLSRRLRRFTDLDSGVGEAVATLSKQVEDLALSVLAAQETAQTSVTTLNDVSGRAESAARHLELLVASMHDVAPASKPNPFRAPKRSEAMQS